jgi:ADP-ribosylglycohydrolase
MFIGDALAMPVHWYYNLNQLRNDFGKITKYEAPMPRFPGSIMNLSNTGGGGRGNDSGSIIGDVILHGKKEFWLKGGQYHYHHGMKAGENTLELYITRLIMRSIVEDKKVDLDKIRQRYCTFMTTPGTHNDTYAGTCHRMFFANYAKKKPFSECPDNDGHNVDTIDGLVNLIPVVLLNACRAAAPTQDLATTVSMCRRSVSLEKRFGPAYAAVLTEILQGKSVRDAAQSHAQQVGLRLDPRAGDPMTACYLDSSYPAMLHFAVKYPAFSDALLASANAGGENVARGACLGAMMGASVGVEGIDKKWIEGLVDHEGLAKDIDAFVAFLSQQG